MKNVSQYSYGLKRRYINGALVSTISATAAHHRVIPGGMVSGNHRDPNNWSYSVKMQRFWNGKTNTIRLSDNNTETNVGEVGSGFGPSSVAWDRTLVYNKALEKLNSKVRGDLDLSIALAEAGTTYRMVKSISKVLDFARLRKFGNTKDLANGWLQWQYGWKPLVSDVFRAADESIRVVLNELETFEVRVTMPLKVNRRYAGDGVPNMPAGHPVDAAGTGKQSCTIRVRMGIPSFDLARWTSLNPVSIAWELIPYSFVVDWFYDVGSYLRNLESAVYYNSAFLGGYVSELYVHNTIDRPMDHRLISGSYAYEVVGVSGRMKYIQFQRSVLASYPFPRSPTFNVDLSSQRLFSAAALLRQLLSK